MLFQTICNKKAADRGVKISIIITIRNTDVKEVIVCYCGRLDLTSSNASTYGIFSKLYATHTILGTVVTKMQTAGTRYILKSVVSH